jgi:hypothetical protein
MMNVGSNSQGFYVLHCVYRIPSETAREMLPSFTCKDFEYAPWLEAAIYKVPLTDFNYAYIRDPSNGVRCCLFRDKEGNFYEFTCRTPAGKAVIPTEESFISNGSDFYHVHCWAAAGRADALDRFAQFPRKNDRLVTHKINIPVKVVGNIREDLEAIFTAN